MVRRQEAVPAVEMMVDEELQAWQGWCASLALGGLINTLYDDVAVHGREGAEQLLAAGSLSPHHAEQIVLRSSKRLLHPPVRRLRKLTDEQQRLSTASEHAGV